MSKNEKFIGYLKYSGEPIQEGLFGARQSAEALLGFDELLRFFLLEEDSNLSNLNFEIPVKIRKGSWMIVIPEMIDQIFSLKGMGHILLTYYGFKTTKKMAEDGLFETGFAKDLSKIFKASMKSIQQVIKIASHVRSLSNKNIKIKEIKDVSLGIDLKILNDKNKPLIVSKKYYDLFYKCPKNLFNRIVKIIDSQIDLSVGVFENGQYEEISVTDKEKDIFYNPPKETEERILPDLKHDQEVELEGQVVRATENKNSIGFQYEGYILICKPKRKQISNYKSKIVSKGVNRFFLEKVKIKGKIDRKDQNKKPQILFSEIIPLKDVKLNEEKQNSLF